MSSENTLVSVRPRRSVLTLAAGSLALAVVPVTVMLALVGSSGNNWVWAVLTEALALAVCLVLGIRQLAVFTRVTDRALEGNGFASPTVRVPLEHIAEVHLVDTFVGQSGDTVTQLLVLDRQGRRLFRLRGNFWPEGTLDRIAAELPVGARRVSEPMSAAHFFERFPTSEYWFENKRWLKATTVLIGAAVAVFVSMWVMAVVGGPHH